MTDLLAATAELVAIPSLSRQEGVIADYVEAALGQTGGLEVVRVGDNVVARTALGQPADWSWPATSTRCRRRTMRHRGLMTRRCGASGPPT